MTSLATRNQYLALAMNSLVCFMRTVCSRNSLRSTFAAARRRAAAEPRGGRAGPRPGAPRREKVSGEGLQVGPS